MYHCIVYPDLNEDLLISLCFFCGKLCTEAYEKQVEDLTKDSTTVKIKSKNACVVYL